jgi:hypothetical protein
MKAILIGSFLLLTGGSCFAWPACNGTWTQIKTPPPGATIYKTSDGLTFQCIAKPTPTAPKPNPKPTPLPILTQNQQSQSQHQTSSSNSTVTATNTAISTGGTANSTSNSQSTNNSTGNTTSVNDNTQYNQVHQTASAITPDAFPTSPCFKTIGGAAQSGLFGASFGSGSIDKGCDDRETARLFARIGNLTAAGRILCDTPAAKRAHLTLEECQAFVLPQPIPAPIIVPPIQPLPEPPIITPAPDVNVNVFVFTDEKPAPPKPPVHHRRKTPCLPACPTTVSPL